TRAHTSRIQRSSCCARAASPWMRPNVCRSSSTASRSGRRRRVSRSFPARCAYVSRLSAALLAVAYTALAVLVAIGDFTRVDQWAVNHLMPASEVHRAKPGWLEAAVPLLHQRWDSPLAIAADIVTLPAGALVSLAIVVLASRVLGIALLAAWAAGAAIELLCKYTLVRPALYSGTYHLGAFDSSFPSGHALRTDIVA